jgi:hypothetical protein
MIVLADTITQNAAVMVEPTTQYPHVEQCDDIGGRHSLHDEQNFIVVVKPFSSASSIFLVHVPP